VKHFWGLHKGGQPEEEKVLRDAVAMAVRNRHAEILEYLLSRECPRQMRDIDYVLRQVGTLGDSPAEEWWAMCTVAIKFKLVGKISEHELLQEALKRCDWGFLEMAKDNGYRVMEEAKDYLDLNLRDQPDGPDDAAVREFYMQGTFRDLVSSMFSGNEALSTWISSRLAPQAALMTKPQGLPVNSELLAPRTASFGDCPNYAPGHPQVRRMPNSHRRYTRTVQELDLMSSTGRRNRLAYQPEPQALCLTVQCNLKSSFHVKMEGVSSSKIFAHESRACGGVGALQGCLSGHLLQAHWLSGSVLGVAPRRPATGGALVEGFGARGAAD
jgi:hypothetical protein